MTRYGVTRYELCRGIHVVRACEHGDKQETEALAEEWLEKASRRGRVSMPSFSLMVSQPLESDTEDFELVLRRMTIVRMGGRTGKTT